MLDREHFLLSNKTAAPVIGSGPLCITMNILDYIGIPTAHAAASPIAVFVGKINRYITNPLIILMFAAALLYFLYGVFNFLSHADDAEARETGKEHILWGVVGMFIMLGVFTILHIIERTLGISPNPNIPS